MKKHLNTLFMFLFGTMIFNAYAGSDKKRSNLNELEEMLQDMASKGNFEATNFENNFDSRGALNLTRAEMSVARRIAPAIAKTVQKPNGQISMYGQNATPEIVHQLQMASKGDLNITVTRNTANITVADLPVALPVVLFGANDFAAGYIGTLNGLVPQGITYSVSTTGTGDILFTFVRTADGATDTITVTNLGNISMRNFIGSMLNNFFKTCYMKVIIPNDSNIGLQFSQPILYGLLSALGAKNFNQLIPRSRIQSWQYLAYVLEVLMPEQKITPDFQFVFTMTGGAGSFIGLDTFMSERGNLNG